ncbi:DNA-binding response regulator, partial [Pseudomonas sp. FW306-02-F08-AA]
MARRTQETDGSDHHGEPTVIIVDDDALVRSA